MKLLLGDFNRLRVVRKVDFGVYLDGGPEGDILLPTRYVPQGLNIGDEVDVFLYLDQEERLTVTTEHPKAKVGDFAWLFLYQNQDLRKELLQPGLFHQACR